MDVISYEYPRQRKDFGKHPFFGDSKAEVTSVGSQREAKAEAAQWVERLSSTVELDCIPSMSEHSVNTERFVQISHGMSHQQGGWPKEVKTSELQDKERYLRRLENLKEYQTAVRRLSRVAERAIQQNNCIDLYESYFEDVEEQQDNEACSAKTAAVFRDPNSTKRSATKISWHPDASSKLAVSYAVLQFQQMQEQMPVSSYIWDVNNPNQPDFEIIPQSPLACLVYNPRSPDHLVGGSYNGLIGFWDLRKGSQSVENSLIEKSHHDPVYDIFWIQSRTGNECVSASTDGQLLWWDVRKLEAGPTDSMLLKGPNDIIHGATSLEYKSDAGATRYLVGTEQGQVLLVDRKAKKDAESQKAVKTVFGTDGGRHHGPVYGVQRHPFAPKYFMSVGDWTTRVWMEDLKSPIITTKYESAYLTAGCWSPTRPGVFFTTKVDGTLDVWDYFFKQNDPVFSTKVGDSALTGIRVHPSGKLVALGSMDGTTTVLEISDGLVDPQPNEKQSIIAMLERETKREKNLEIRNNIKKREKNQEKKKNQPPPTAAGRDYTASPVPSSPNGGPAEEKDEKVIALLKQVEENFAKAMELSIESLVSAPASKDYSITNTSNSSSSEEARPKSRGTLSSQQLEAKEESKSVRPASVKKERPPSAVAQQQQQQQQEEAAVVVADGGLTRPASASSRPAAAVAAAADSGASEAPAADGSA